MLRLLLIVSTISSSIILAQHSPDNNLRAEGHGIPEEYVPSDIKEQGQSDPCCGGGDPRCFDIVTQDICEHFAICKWNCDGQPTQNPVNPTCTCTGNGNGMSRRCVQQSERDCSELHQCHWVCSNCSCLAQGQFAAACSQIHAESVCGMREECSWQCGDEEGDVTYIAQSSFDAGTLRITTPGVYVFTENVEFNPNPNNDYLPIYPDQANEYPVAPHGPYHLGFFAGISVETCGVTIDLGGYLFRSSDAFAFQHRFLSLIELANMPFIPGEGPSDFGPEIVSACNTTIRNGSFGLTPHHAIHGNGNSGITIEHIKCFDFEIACIHLNGPSDVIIDDVDVGPSRQDLPILSAYSDGRFMRTFLRDIQAADPNASLTFGDRDEPASIGEIIDNLEHQMNLVFEYFVNNDVSVTEDPQWESALGLFNANGGQVVFPDGASLYGIVLNKFGIASNGIGFGDTEESFSNIVVSNVVIHDMDINIIEVVAIGYNGDPMLGPVGEVFDYTMISSDPFTATNNFYVGNVVQDAQIAIAKLGAELGLDIGTTYISEEVIAWATNPISFEDAIAESSNHSLICNGDGNHHAAKGIFGLRIEFIKSVRVNDVNITNLYNHGALGSYLCGQYDSPDDPGGNSVGTPGEIGYMGADVRAISIAEADDIRVEEVTINQIQTNTGNAYGIDIRERSFNISLEYFEISGVQSYLDVDDGEDLPLPNENPFACAVAIHEGSLELVYVNHVTAGNISAEEQCESEVAATIQDGAVDIAHAAANHIPEGPGDAHVGGDIDTVTGAGASTGAGPLQEQTGVLAN